MESSAPAGVVEEMGDLVKGEAGSLRRVRREHLILRSDEGPVDEERAADEIGAGDEAPVAAVEAVGAVVAHDEVHIGWDDEVFALDVGGEVEGPTAVTWRSEGGWNGGEFVVVGVVVGGGGLGGVGLVLGDSVEVEDAVAEVDAVAGDADDALDEDIVLALGLQDRPVEDDGLVAAEFAIGDEGVQEVDGARVARSTMT